MSNSDQPPQKRRRNELWEGDVRSLLQSFARLQEARDGVALHALLRSTEREPCPSDVEVPGGTEPIAAAVARAWVKGASEESIEALSGALKRWCVQYAAGSAHREWMLPPLLWLSSRPRILATQLDAGSRDRQLKKLVEVVREMFQKLHTRETRHGCMAMCCELLRLYFLLGQASQCGFLLAAVSQSRGISGEKFDPAALPKSLAVTLCFMWGKHCVLDGKVTEAEEKLSWALTNCPPAQEGNRRRILEYLVPCRLRLGHFPSQKMLKRHGLQGFEGICRATWRGDVRLFDSEFGKQESWLIRTGTYLMVEKLKTLVYRNLCVRVHQAVAKEIDKKGKSEHRHKQDLRPYEIAFRWQDDFDEIETVGMLAHLIYLGAIRGYISDEHQKIVFSKDAPFPAAEVWNVKLG